MVILEIVSRLILIHGVEQNGMGGGNDGMYYNTNSIIDRYWIGMGTIVDLYIIICKIF
jgi:hypothetical protein